MKNKKKSKFPTAYLRKFYTLYNISKPYIYKRKSVPFVFNSSVENGRLKHILYHLRS